jgi:predicted dehydrogenase
MEKLRIGVMGCANIALRSVIPALISIPRFQLVAVASRTQQNANKFAQTFGCEAIVGYKNLVARNDLDAIYMPLPTGLHQEWVLKCLKDGKHVLAEKSMASDFGSAKLMVEKARKNNLLLMENYMFQFHSQHEFVFSLLNNDEIGEIRIFRSSFGFPPLDENNFRYNEQIGGGALLDAAGYPVKASQLFLGERLRVKAADLHVDKTKKVNIYGSAYLSNEKNVVSEIAFGFDHYYQCNYEIWGSKGKITVDRAFTPPPGFKPRILLEKQDLRQEFHVKPDNHFVNILKEFHRAIDQQDHEKHLKEILTQSRLLSEIREKNGK